VTGIFDVLEMALDRAPEIFFRDPRWHEFLDRMNALRAEPAALAASTPISNGTTKETA
jgi:hypothetical protein